MKKPRKTSGTLKHVSEPAFFATLYGFMAPLARRNPYYAAQCAFVAGMITAEQAAAHAASDRYFIELDYSQEEGSTPYSAALRIVRERWAPLAIQAIQCSKRIARRD
jgi:hypothetical protein